MPVRTAPVLFINAATERGGAETVLLTLLRHLDRDRFPAHVCCLRDGPLVDDFRHAGADVTRIPAGSLRQMATGLRVVRRLHALMTSHGIKVVHGNGTAGHIYGSLAARRAGVPSVYHAHDAPDASWRGQGLVDRLARLIPATVVVAPSRFLAECLTDHPVRSARVVRIENGLDAVPEAGRAGDDGPVAVWCGRLQRWKGAHVFLQAAAAVRCEFPSARFIVVGGTLLGLEPDYEPELRALAARLGVESAVRFVGHQPAITPFLAQADVVVHSSIAPEPFGLVIVEAMLAGKPVVAAAAGGPLEIVESDVTGLLVAPGDSEALAGAIARLFRDPARCACMGEAGRARARTIFSAVLMTQRFEALYADLAWGAAGDGTRL